MVLKTRKTYICFVRWVVYIFCFLLFSVGTQLAFSQKCLTSVKSSHSLEQHHHLKEKREEFLKKSTDFLSPKNNIIRVADTSTYTVPVVVHVIYRTEEQNISNEQILSQIEVLNQDFSRNNADTNLTPNRFKDRAANAGIQFCLAKEDPDGNATSGITRTQTQEFDIGYTENYYRESTGGTTIWDPTKYLNIYVCEIGNDVLGFTYLPASALPDRDAVVVDYRNFGTTGTVLAPYNRGRTTTHEVGHWFNLEHTWGASSESCSEDDGVSDTPIQFTANNNCPTSPVFSCGNQSLGGDMFMNFMEYTVDRCQNLFTEGQRARMRAALFQYRSSLLISTACGNVNEPINTEVIFDAFPNPSGDEFTLRIRLPFEQTDVTVGIYSPEGKLVKTWKYSSLLRDNVTLSARDLGSGVFIAQLTYGANIHTFKLVSISDF